MKFTVSEAPTWGASCGATHMDKKIVVPEGMLKAARRAVDSGRMNGAILNEDLNRWLEAALRWLDAEISRLRIDTCVEPLDKGFIAGMEEVRKLFLAQELEIPEEVKDLLFNIGEDSNNRIIEAYRRGQRSK